MRICARIGCGQPISEHARADALYHSRTCAREASRQRNGFQAPSDPTTFPWSEMAGRHTLAWHRGRERYATRRLAA